MNHEVPLIRKPGVTVVAVEASLEAPALRSALEAYNFLVRTYWVGSRRELLKILSEGLPTDDIIVLSCHGVKEGIHVPDEQPVPPEEIGATAQLARKVVINLGCLTGSPEFQAAFHKAGVGHYIGPTGYPEGNAALLYCFVLFYNLALGQSLHEAHRKASDVDSENGQFVLT